MLCSRRKANGGFGGWVGFCLWWTLDMFRLILCLLVPASYQQACCKLIDPNSSVDSILEIYRINSD